MISSGLASSRDPSSDFTGTLEIESIVASNGETFLVTDAGPTTIMQDPCHADNQVNGYVPTNGDVCYRPYAENGNQLIGGATQGTGNTPWYACTGTDLTSCGINKEDITALRFTTNSIPTTA